MPIIHPEFTVALNVIQDPEHHRSTNENVES